MSLGQVRLGPRTLKTALSVMLCILLFQLLKRDTPMIACLAAVFALRQSVSSSISFGGSRIIGNTFGGACGIFYFLVYRNLDHHFLVELFLIPLLVIVIIMTADTFNLNTAIIGACSTFFIIVLTVPETETIWYAIDRVIDTMIGTLIALGVNYALKRPEPLVAEKGSEVDLENQIAQKKAEIAELEKEINQLED